MELEEMYVCHLCKEQFMEWGYIDDDICKPCAHQCPDCGSQKKSNEQLCDECDRQYRFEMGEIDPEDPRIYLCK